MEKEQNIIVDVTALAVINNYEEKLRQMENVLDDLMERLNKKSTWKKKKK